MEATFTDGSKLVHLSRPITSEDGDLELALYGSFLPVPSLEVFGDSSAELTAGRVTCQGDELILNAGRPVAIISVQNTSDRPIQVHRIFSLPHPRPSAVLLDDNCSLSAHLAEKVINISASSFIKYMKANFPPQPCFI